MRCLADQWQYSKVMQRLEDAHFHEWTNKPTQPQTNRLNGAHTSLCSVLQLRGGYTSEVATRSSTEHLKPIFGMWKSVSVWDESLPVWSRLGFSIKKFALSSSDSSRTADES